MSNMYHMTSEVVPSVFTCFMNQGYAASLDLQDVSEKPT